MCPMRVFLLLFSAIIAGYLAWRNLSRAETSILNGPEERSEVSNKKIKELGSERQFYSKVSSSVGVLVDMVSGRYLWKHLRSAAQLQEASR